MMDNRSGNRSEQTVREAYCQLFSELRMPYNNCIANCSDSEVKADSASAGWVLQMAHQTKLYQDPNNKIALFSPSYLVQSLFFIVITHSVINLFTVSLSINSTISTVLSYFCIVVRSITVFANTVILL
jgi:hypothetical protein